MGELLESLLLLKLLMRLLELLELHLKLYLGLLDQELLVLLSEGRLGIAHKAESIRRCPPGQTETLSFKPLKGI